VIPTRTTRACVALTTLLSPFTLLTLLTLLVGAGACGSSSDGTTIPAATPPAGLAPGPTAPPAGEATGATPTSPVGTTAPTPPAAGAPCTGKEALQGPRDLDWTLAAGGVDRTVHVHVPKGYDATKPSPVVLDFHGYTSNGAEQNLLAHMNVKADAVTFIAVHPEGTGTTPSWNAGACCGDAAANATDDVGFVGAIIDELESKLCVDAHRVFATGMSNGGFLSHRLACELSTRIAAVAPVAGLLAIPTCNPTRPTSVFHFHGTLDPLVPYDGSPTMGFPSVLQTMSGWATRTGCSATPRETSKKGDVTCTTYDGCKGGAEISLCTVTGGGHTWPGGLPVPSLGYTTTNIIATDAMWDFFVKHPLP
jgi:polyhydroxybutyrate depolymerase